MKIATNLVLAALLTAVAVPPAMARDRAAERASLSRADRIDYDNCMKGRKKGGNKGAVIGAAGAGGVAAIAGGNVGESLLAAGVGAVAGNVVGKGGRCDAILDRGR